MQDRPHSCIYDFRSKGSLTLVTLNVDYGLHAPQKSVKLTDAKQTIINKVLMSLGHEKQQ